MYNADISSIPENPLEEEKSKGGKLGKQRLLCPKRAKDSFQGLLRPLTPQTKGQ